MSATLRGLLGALRRLCGDATAVHTTLPFNPGC